MEFKFRLNNLDARGERDFIEFLGWGAWIVVLIGGVLAYIIEVAAGK